MTRRPSAESALVWSLLLLLGAGIVYPLLQVLSVAVMVDGRPTAAPLLAFFARPLFREALVNTLVSGVLAVALGSLIAVPLALLTVRYSFPGRGLLTTLGLLPLVIPPFVGAVAFQQILGRSGTVNLFLLERFGVTVPFMEGLWGVIMVQTLHYFPFIWLNTAAALSALDRSLEEAAQNLGSSGFRLFRRVLLPLSLPGYAAGALLTFIRVIDDLGTPLMLNYTKLLAPQAYMRVTTVGLTDVDGYVICAVLVALSLSALWISKGLLGRGDFTSLGRSGETPAVALGATGTLAVWAIAILLLGPALLPHVGIALLSVSKVWSLSPLPSVYTLGNYDEILFRAPHFIWNTLRYALLAAALDVGLGTVIAWLLLRGRTRGRQWLDAIATMPLAVPGVVLAVGYLHVFHGWSVPGLGAPLTSTWLILVIVYAVRRLPYTVRGAYAALQQLPVSLEEAAQNLGASRARAFLKVTLPLMGRGLLAGGLLAFVSSAVDLSSTILLVPHVELGPLSYGIYLYMQSAVGRGPGAALGVVAIALVAAGTWLATRLARGGAGLFRA
ncbi:MAG: iron ABC transporter permease [Candidatus Rokubacteria bacterium]|nr:iron ABC transporter permease [Candidatus Rokubacteria bacterium]